MWYKLIYVCLVAAAVLLPMAPPPGATSAAPPARPAVTRYAGPFNTRQQAEAWGTDHRTGGTAVFFATNGPNGINNKWWFRWEQIT
jgi:hypothetical protein